MGLVMPSLTGAFLLESLRIISLTSSGSVGLMRSVGGRVYTVRVPRNRATLFFEIASESFSFILVRESHASIAVDGWHGGSILSPQCLLEFPDLSHVWKLL